MYYDTDDLRIAKLRPLIPPAILMEELPITETASTTVAEAREQSTEIICGDDDRLLVVTGPCSIHDPAAAREYAENLVESRKRYGDELCIIMRVYFEKPRTTVGWKGLINDPGLDGTFDINRGLRVARKLLLDLGDMTIPVGSELLDTITPQFIGDLIAWAAIGARTTESQIHRELASGMSVPVGFKNGTDGNIQISLDAIRAARCPHHFLSVTKQGLSAIVSTTGNDAGHVILRGSTNGPNYDARSVESVRKALADAGLPERVMIDCSHGNSRKDYKRQAEVAEDVAGQVVDGAGAICGVMLESHLVEGRQDLKARQDLTYGQSITDACMSWEQTEPVLEKLAQGVRKRRALRGAASRGSDVQAAADASAPKA